MAPKTRSTADAQRTASEPESTDQEPAERHMAEWVALTLKEEGVSAPAGFAYLGHSLHSGGSSAAEAIKVSRFRGNWLGGWSQT